MTVAHFRTYTSKKSFKFILDKALFNDLISTLRSWSEHIGYSYDFIK
jgi:hypothetical protein